MSATLPSPASVLDNPISETRAETTKEIPALDGWRAVSIALVVLSHSLWNTSRAAEKTGALGVNLFFAISGYLICTLLLRERELTGTISLRRFYIRRFFRIAPPALSYLLVVALLAGLGWIQLRPHEVSTAFLTANYFPDRSWFTAHYWSLSVEEHFYLAWPGLLVLLGPYGASAAGLLLSAASVIYRPWVAANVMGGFRYQRSDMRIDTFVLPCLLAILLRNRRWRDRAARYLTPLAIVPLIAVAVAGSYLAEAHPGYQTYNKLLLAAVLPLIIVMPILHGESLIARILNWKILKGLGRISYGVYLWQQIFLFDTSRSSGRRLLIPFAAAGILVVAWMSNRFLEKPLRAVGHRLAGRLDTESPTVAGNVRSTQPLGAFWARGTD
jgi:peptidoglycan/LPS O-acetylase OafA/YrhL